MKKRGRGRPRKINLRSTDSIINATLNQLSKLSPKDLRSAYSRLRQTALKRLKRLRENQLDYLDIYKLNREDFAAKPSSMTDSEVAQALLNARNFLDNPTSTVRGAKKELQDRAKTIKETIDYDTNYGGIIDPTDPAMLRVWGDFMDTLRASSEYELVYDLEDLRELWNVYQRRANADTFTDTEGKHYRDLDEAFERFMESPDTIPLFDDETSSGAKSAGKRQSERRRVLRIRKRRQKQ